MLSIGEKERLRQELGDLMNNAFNEKRAESVIKALAKAGAARTLYELGNYNKLKQSDFSYTPQVANRKEYTVDIIPRTSWVKWQVFGTRPHMISPDPSKKILSNLFTTFPRSPLFVTSRPINHPGTKPNPAMQQAIRKAALAGVALIRAEGSSLFVKANGKIQLRDERTQRWGPTIGTIGDLRP